MRNKGFTLIEFLVVMALIAVLGILGGNAYFESLKKGRDARGIEDVQTIQKGFELYYTLHDDAYNTASIMFADSSIFPNGELRNKDGASYITNPGPGGYCACIQLQSKQYYTKYANSGADCNFAAADKQYYCARNIQ